MPELWVGIDAGKREHHCVVIDEGGTKLLSRRVENDESTLLELIAEVRELASGDPVTWATDLNAGGAAALIDLVTSNGQRLLYIPGRIVHHASATYRGDGKTDAKDAGIIADQARMRRDLQPIRGADQISVDLRIMTARHTDLICDRVRAINRLRATLLEYFPALERAFDYSKSKAALTLLTTYRTPEALRRIGRTRLQTWLKNRGCRNSAGLAQRAIEAADTQHNTLPTQSLGAVMVAKLGAQITAIDAELVEFEKEITDRFLQHSDALILLSMPGFGPILGATFLANTGGDLSAFESADRLASVAGLAPAPRDSGRISGNHHRPRRYNRRLLRVCCLAAFSSLKNSPASRIFYNRKRGEGKNHKQAL
ncbi:MAG: IS110 family transposase, partial [Actinomycetota bacterium]